MSAYVIGQTATVKTMPDGPGYENDFFAWTQYQAEALRSMAVTDNRFDRENIAEVGQRVVITAGVPFGTPGATNILRIAWVDR